jgi:hypothetical protein
MPGPILFIFLCGQHVFRKNPEKLNHYKSDHYQRLGSMGAAVEAEETAKAVYGK